MEQDTSATPGDLANPAVLKAMDRFLRHTDRCPSTTKDETKELDSVRRDDTTLLLVHLFRCLPGIADQMGPDEIHEYEASDIFNPQETANEG